jgi:hypothetical protein
MWGQWGLSVREQLMDHLWVRLGLLGLYLQLAL